MSDQINRPNQVPQTPPKSLYVGLRPLLRLWPGIVLAALLWLMRGWATIGEFAQYKFFIGLLIAPLVVLAGLLLWWLFASRLRWSDRLLVVGTFAAVTASTMFLADPSFRGPALLFYVLPLVVTAWPAWLLLSFWLSWPVRRAGILLIFIAVGVLCLCVRVDGMDGNFVAKFSWRWTPTSEEQLLVELKSKVRPLAPQASVKISEQPGDWPGFRGPRRDSRLSGVRIKTDWQQSPPPLLWRHRIGPGWSSLAVVGDRLFTQEQRGADEYVVCYDATSGAEVWTFHDTTRFYEVVAGPGPRATPTFHLGRLYTFGANGHLNCLEAASGEPVWSHDVAAEFKASDAEKDIPQWGFASSPLVAHGVVVVFAGARDGKTVVAYKVESGELAWTASVGPTPEKVALSYCSPQLAAVNGVEQVLLATDAGLSAFEPASGKELWHYAWLVSKTARIIQPALVGEDDLLLGTGLGNGTRRIHVNHSGDEWSTEQRWATHKIKPYFNDFVVFNGYFYGFDLNKLVCFNVEDGSEIWRTSGYGNGQVLLLTDQGLLLVLSEEGDVALVPARPEKHAELCRFKALEGKTWNHPVIAHGRLFVRNGEEIACFALAPLD
jgi:outer membrane protein assembly factor BamB